jgi:peptide/nickel transport system substrate-binding protein
MSATTRRLVAVLLGASLAVAGCTAGSSTAPSNGASGTSGVPVDTTLAIGLVLEPVSLDFTTNDGAAIPQLLLTNVYEGLVKLDADGTIVPSLAKAWTVSADGKTYTFDLVDNATFTNGAKLTADDVVFSINRVLKDWTTSLKAKMIGVEKVTAVSPTQVQVDLAAASNEWLYSMTTRVGAIFSKTGVDDLANKPVGTGPYVFDSWKRGDSITLKRNDSYWGTKPYFSTVTMKYFKDPTALNNALLTKTIDVIGTVQAPESLAQFDTATYDVIEGATNGEVVLSFNNGKGLLTNKDLRMAIRHAIDHRALVDTCWAGHGQLIGSMVPPTDPWYEDLTAVTPFDQAKAKALIAKAGAEGKTLRLRVPAVPYATSCGTVVKSQLEQVGLTVDLEQIEFSVWLEEVFTNVDYDMSIVAHVEPHDLPAVFGNPDYYLRYDSKAVRDAVKAANGGTVEEQVASMKAAARTIAEDAAADFLFLLPNLMVAEKGITGLPKNAVGESFDLTLLARS